MCGIFGFVSNNKEEPTCGLLKTTVSRLFKLSESRGKDASGIAILNDNKITVFKSDMPASDLIKLDKYKDIIEKTFGEKGNKTISAIGHARMVTNGSMRQNYNNQPVIKDGLVAIHNGIIVNDKDIWNKYPSLERRFEVDTEVFLSLVRKFRKEGNSLIKSVNESYSLIKGAASIASFFNDLNYLLLTTNTGSIYYIYKPELGFFVFASEFYFLQRLIKDNEYDKLFFESEIKQLHSNEGCLISLDNLEKIDFPIGKNTCLNYKDRKVDRKIIGMSAGKKIPNCKLAGNISDKETNKIINDTYIKTKLIINKLKRCSGCVLPETMPYIKFNKDGICNYCLSYEKMQIEGGVEFEKVISKHRRKNGKPDCIVTFSGGRDSSYALYYIKKILKMNPVAYSYDWGMLTDLGRRNQARMTGALGVEHILISADINKKRENIKKSVEAWLRKPNLGTVPLFMAGDKQYFYYANMLKKQMGIDLVILCENPLERTDFKSGFCGIKPKKMRDKKFYSLSLINIFKLFLYYTKEYLSNPSYINSSLYDTLWAFASYYLIPHNFISFYNYIRWDEKKIEQTLKKYDWETANDTLTTWRIGDGTASFYNYIYYTLAGFTENDTFRSNQVREGNITRREALKIVYADNKPRYESLKWYCETIGIDLKKALIAINKKPALFSMT